MSPTLLELLMAIIVLFLAWQIGLTIAPTIIRALWKIKQDVEEAAEEALENPEQPQQPQIQEENNHEIRH